MLIPGLEARCDLGDSYEARKEGTAKIKGRLKGHRKQIEEASTGQIWII